MFDFKIRAKKAKQIFNFEKYMQKILFRKNHAKKGYAKKSRGVLIFNYSVVT